MIKNEHPYLEEWINYHLNIGFNEIIIVEDYGSASHKDITSKFSNVTLYTAEEFFNKKWDYIEKSSRTQKNVYNKFITDHINENAWCAFIDIDEFIMIDENETLDSITSYLDANNITSLALFWKIFNANGHIARPKNISTIDAYTNEIIDIPLYTKRDLFYLFKSFVKMNGIKTDIFIQNVHTSKNLKNIDGETVDFYTFNRKPQVRYNKIYINHYFTKSWQDWKRRIQRGNPTNGIRKLEDFFILNPEINIKLK